MFERFSDDARRIVTGSASLAAAAAAPEVDTGHLLVVLADDPGIAGTAIRQHGLSAEQLRRELDSPGDDLDAAGLRDVGIELEDVRRTVEESFGRGALEEADATPARRRRPGGRRFGGGVRFGDDLKAALGQSLREALRLGHGGIGAEDLLLGLLGRPDGHGLRILRRLEVDPQALRHSVLDARRRSA